MSRIDPFRQQQYSKQLSFGQQGTQRPQESAGASQAAFSAGAPKGPASPFAITPTTATQGPANQGIPKGGHSGGDQLAQFKGQIASGQIKPNLEAPGLGPNSRMSWTA